MAVFRPAGCMTDSEVMCWLGTVKGPAEQLLDRLSMKPNVCGPFGPVSFNEDHMYFYTLTSSDYLDVLDGVLSVSPHSVLSYDTKHHSLLY